MKMKKFRLMFAAVHVVLSLFHEDVASIIKVPWKAQFLVCIVVLNAIIVPQGEHGKCITCRLSTDG